MTTSKVLSSYKNTATFQARAVLINAGQANAATVISPEFELEAQSLNFSTKGGVSLPLVSI